MEHLTRQLDLIPMASLDYKITVIGAGAIGSWTVLALAKMGFWDITVFDDDTVTIENMNCQFFRFSDIGKSKALALQAMVKDFTGVEIEAFNQRYGGKNTFNGIVISAVDSMSVRRMIWEAHQLSPFTKVIIDPRMGAEDALMYSMRPNDKTDRETYRKSLYTDAQAMPERCTAKSTIYTANMLSGLVCKAVKDIVTDKPYPRITHWSIAANEFQCFSS